MFPWNTVISLAIYIKRTFGSLSLKSVSLQSKWCTLPKVAGTTRGTILGIVLTFAFSIVSLMN